MTDEKNQKGTYLKSIPDVKRGVEKKSKPKKDSIKQYILDELDYQIMAIILKHPSATQEGIAKDLGYKRSAIATRMRRPAFKEVLVEHSKKAIDQIEEVQALAMRRLKSLIQSRDPVIATQNVRLALQPFFNIAQVNINKAEEILYKVQFGEGGTLFQDVIEIEAEEKTDLPKSTMDLLS